MTPPARALGFLRRALVRNQFRAVFLSGSRLRVVTIAVFSALLWTGLFSLFFEGFRFLGTFVGPTSEIVETIFGLFFLSLLILMLFSAGIILHFGLFHAREAAFLLTTPAPADRVFAFKFVEAIAFSSWGFLLLGTPLMVAYGITVGAGASFYLLFLAFLVAFVFIPGSLGAVGAVLVANLMPRRRGTALAALGTAALLAAAALALRVVRTPGEISREWLDALLSRLSFSQNPLLPSRWVAIGLVGAARGETAKAAFYLFQTAAHAALAYLVAAVVARDLYRRGYGRVQGDRASRRRLSGYLLDAAFHRAFAFVPRPVRLLILKDIRTFRRDPAQWSQFLIFFGLLAIYFVNIRRLGYNVQSAYFKTLLSLLNLSVTALILSTFTTRFIFPLMSLEGRNFWVLGLLPVRREAILWGKFAFAAGISLVATEALVVTSDLMLELSATMIAVHVALVAVLCLGLSGISVGLGARLPNLKEDDPSKIAAGFGGTLNLLVSLLFILLVVAALALPCELYFSRFEVNAGTLVPISPVRFRTWLVGSILASLVLGAFATIAPLRVGIRAFQRMEF